jgi:hypothetical protein
MNAKINQKNSLSEDFILLKIKKHKKNLIVISGVLFLFIILFSIIFNNYYYNFLFGPFYKNSEDLNSINNVNSLKEYFVTVEGTDFYETGISYTERDGNRQVVISNCFLLNIEDKFLFVDIPRTKEPNLLISGKLKQMPDELLDALKNTYVESEISIEEFEYAVYPFILDARPFRQPGYLGIILCMIPLLIIVINIIKIILYTLKPKIHPIYKVISKYGDLDAVASDINNELQMETTEKYFNTTITKSWLIVEEFNNLKIFKLTDIIWAYKVINTQSGDVPISYQLNIKFYNKKSLEISFTKKEVLLDKAISSILDKVPWIISGYSTEMFDMWLNNFEDFISMVDNNKGEFS